MNRLLPALIASAVYTGTAANTAVATLSLPTAGTYRVEIDVCSQDTVAVGKGLVVEHRNAGDTATNNRLGGCSAGESRTIVVERLVVAAGEKVRVITGSAAPAASSQQVASIRAYPIM